MRDGRRHWGEGERAFPLVPTRMQGLAIPRRKKGFSGISHSPALSNSVFFLHGDRIFRGSCWEVQEEEAFTSCTSHRQDVGLQGPWSFKACFVKGAASPSSQHPGTGARHPALQPSPLLLTYPQAEFWDTMSEPQPAALHQQWALAPVTPYHEMAVTISGVLEAGMHELGKCSPLGKTEKLGYLTQGKVLAPASAQKGISAVGRDIILNVLSDLHPYLYNPPWKIKLSWTWRCGNTCILVEEYKHSHFSIHLLFIWRTWGFALMNW